MVADAIARRWQRSVPPQIYAVVRILAALVALGQTFSHGAVGEFWAPDGIVAGSLHAEPLKAWLLEHGLSLWFGWGLFLANVAVYAALALGYRTRTMTVAAFALLALQPWWNRLTISGVHTVLRGIFFGLMWVDAGAVWSLDRKRTAHPAATAVPIWPLLVVQWQVALVYLGAGLQKLNYPLWRDGSALHYIMLDDFFGKHPELVTPDSDPYLRVLTWLTVAAELAFPVLIVPHRTRPYILALGAMGHLAMSAVLQIGWFTPAMLAAYACFVSPEWLARIESALLRRTARSQPQPLAGS